MHRKAQLPTKQCPVCDRPFAWRRKWARDWERVIYCSKRCRRSRKSAPPAAGPRGGAGPW
ncbi:MAG: DUF2256 domain-containing protein [Oleiphilaceae bacterium]|nr:DUF2256 domain-containing protein [Oleiphilaceae bacterium]